jgi:hypothetical protein
VHEAKYVVRDSAQHKPGQRSGGFVAGLGVRLIEPLLKVGQPRGDFGRQRKQATKLRVDLAIHAVIVAISDQNTPRSLFVTELIQPARFKGSALL